jgi:hypothetical protein
MSRRTQAGGAKKTESTSVAKQAAEKSTFCHSEQSEESLRDLDSTKERFLASLGMTKS